MHDKFNVHKFNSSLPENKFNSSLPELLEMLLNTNNNDIYTL